MLGRNKCIVNGRVFYVTSPSPACLLEACEVFNNTLRDASFYGLITDEEMLDYMFRQGIWNDDMEGELNTAPKRIEAMKIEMYRQYSSFSDKRVQQIRKLLDKTRDRTNELFTMRHFYDSYTLVGLAKSLKIQFIIGKNLVDINNNPIDFWSMYDGEANLIISEYFKNTPSEHDIRQIAKSSEWRSIWMASKTGAVLFDVPAIQMTNLQKDLIGWSRLYDSINEHPEPPDDTVIEDDDLLDGWLIIEDIKRKEEKRQRDGEKRYGSRSKKQGGSQEIFIPAESPEAAARINAMNETSSLIVKKQRMNLLKKKGKVAEQHMPDSQQQMVMQATKEFAKRMKEQR
jgi:hypothetical protein